MKSIKHGFAELLNLTQLYLLREYSLKEAKMVDPVTFGFFQNKMKSSFVLPSTKKVRPPPLASMAPVQMPKNSLSATTVPPSPDPRPPETRPEPPPSEPLPPPNQPEPLIPDPKPPAIQDHSSKGKGFILEPMTSASSTKDYREFWKLCSTLFLDWILCETIPSDALAQKHKNAWLNHQTITPVIILAFHEEEKQLAFLKNIAQAISLCLAPTRVLSAQKLEKENCWENVLNSPHLRLIIACDYGLYLQPNLMRFYREIPQQSKHLLNQIPLLLLSDLSLYLKEPQLKPLLWRAICNEFASLQQL